MEMSSMHRFQAVGAGLKLSRGLIGAGGSRPSGTTVLRNTSSDNSQASPRRQTKAVIFDMGGVIVPSPMPFFFGKLSLVIGLYKKKIYQFEYFLSEIYH